jgi:hypothetical protein
MATPLVRRPEPGDGCSMAALHGGGNLPPSPRAAQLIRRGRRAGSEITRYGRSQFTLASLRLADEDSGRGRATVQD